MGRRMSRQHPAVERDARPGDALHVGHESIIIQVRVMVLHFLNDAIDPGGRFTSFLATRHRRPQDPPLGIIDGDPLVAERNDDHDRVARGTQVDGLDRALAPSASGRRVIPRCYQSGQTRNGKTHGLQPSLHRGQIPTTKGHALALPHKYVRALGPTRLFIKPTVSASMSKLTDSTQGLGPFRTWAAPRISPLGRWDEVL